MPGTGQQTHEHEHEDGDGFDGGKDPIAQQPCVQQLGASGKALRRRDQPNEVETWLSLGRSKATPITPKDLARLAKSAHMALQRDAERLTGLKVGGISPLALLDKRFEVYLDAPGASLDELYINGGQRGVNLRLRVADLLAVTGARVIAATAMSR